MFWTAIIPFIFQAVAILFDEGFFHIRRGLPKWERIGHPLDTLTTVSCLSYILWVPFSSMSLFGYILLAIFSTLFITKDEFVHSEHCPPAEQWLHAVLFTLHPITLAIAGFIWPVIQGVEVAHWIVNWLNDAYLLKRLLIGQIVCMSLFMLHQIVYWNIFYERNKQ